MHSCETFVCLCDASVFVSKLSRFLTWFPCRDVQSRRFLFCSSRIYFDCCGSRKQQRSCSENTLTSAFRLEKQENTIMLSDTWNWCLIKPTSAIEINLVPSSVGIVCTCWSARKKILRGIKPALLFSFHHPAQSGVTLKRVPTQPNINLIRMVHTKDVPVQALNPVGLKCEPCEISHVFKCVWWYVGNRNVSQLQSFHFGQTFPHLRADISDGVGVQEKGNQIVQTFPHVAIDALNSIVTEIKGSQVNSFPHSTV